MMQELGQGQYTRDEVMAVLHSDSRRIRFRYDLVDRANRFIRQLDNVQSCTVEHNMFRDIKRTASFVIRDDDDIDFFSERIKPYVEFQMDDGGWVRFPQGVFLIDAPKQRVTAAGVKFRELEGYDGGRIIQQDTVFSARYAIPAGSVYTDVVESLLANSGINETAIPASPLTVPTMREYDPGTSRGKIINELLAAINYDSIWFDSKGTARSQSSYNITQDAWEYTYETNEESVIRPGLEREFDYFDIPNQLTLISSNPDRSALYATYTNSNAASPVSTVNRGRTVARVITNDDSPTQTVIEAKAVRMLQDASQVYQKVKFSTAIMPHHENRAFLRLVHSQIGEDAVYQETGWRMPFTVDGEMTHELRKLVYV